MNQSVVNHQRRLGAIMLELELLRPEQIEPILRAQREFNLPFGAAAVRLGLLTEDQLEQALYSQFDYPYLTRGTGGFSSQLVAAYEHASPHLEVLRTIRSQLLLRWFNASRRVLAIMSPQSGEGRSYITANLGIVFSQLGENTLLIDANLRAPHLHSLFNLENRQGLSSILAGMINSDASIQRIPYLSNLSLLSAGPLPPNPVELLARPGFVDLLSQLSKQYEIILIDTPPGLECSETATLAAWSGGTLIVIHKDHTRLNKARLLTESVRDAGAEVVGCVLNEF